VPRFPVSVEKEQELLESMAKLKIVESDLTEKFIKGSGPGGQKINTSSSTVYLKHLPSGIEIKCQESRSQALNRYYARKWLVKALRQQIEGALSEEEQLRQKIKRQKRRRSRRAKQKLLENKHHQSQKKSMRKTPNASGEVS
jgi:protein subunit release factor B